VQLSITACAARLGPAAGLRADALGTKPTSRAPTRRVQTNVLSNEGLRAVRVGARSRTHRPAASRGF
jgi:hypothetical protein